MERYKKYKDSGIEWIGKIPEHWEDSFLKYVLDDIISGGTPSTNISKFWTTGNNGITWVSIADITESNGVLYKTERRITKNGQKSKKLKIIPKETLLISIFASLGKTTTLKIDATVNQAILGLVSFSKLHKDFLKFYLNFVKNFISYYSSSNTQENLNLNKIKNLPVVYPTIPEQTTIANYLDRKTAEIDELIKQKEQLLKLYEEEKTAIINQAVTKGIPRKDALPCVSTKDSGIDWLGEIPEHWEVKKLKYLVKINSKTISDKTDKNYQLKYIDIGNVEYGKLKEKPKELLFSNAPSRARRIVKSGDTLISTVRTYLKSILFIENTDDNLIASTGFAVISPSDLFIANYLFYILSNEIIIQNITSNSVGVSYPAINASDIGNFYIWLPPKDEQVSIIDYIESETTRINIKAEKTRKLIELLKEYKTALISEVVTGKVKVIN